MNKTFEFYYHGPKCKYIFNHINLVNKIPSHNKAFEPLYNFIRNKHHNYPNAHGQAQSAYSCHFKKALSFLPQQTMLPFAIDLTLSILYLSLHFEAFVLQLF
jgi:hypothetical protein